MHGTWKDSAWWTASAAATVRLGWSFGLRHCAKAPVLHPATIACACRRPLQQPSVTFGANIWPTMQANPPLCTRVQPPVRPPGCARTTDCRPKVQP
jgi:hypothetical protein